MVCANCFTNLSGGHYCHECGQKSTDLRYSLKGMFTDFFFSVLHVEKKGLPHTIRELTLRPGEAIRRVISGQRQYLYPPFKYLVLMGAAVIIFSLRYKFFHSDYTQTDKMSNLLEDFLIEEHLTYLDGFFAFAEEKATILNIASIPIFAFVSWAFVTRKKYNFAENLIINSFITAQQLFFLLTLVPVIELLPAFKGQIIFFYSFTIIIYNIVVYMQLMEKKKLRVMFASLLAVIFSFAYQVPVNLLIYFLYEKSHGHFHWVHDMM